MLQELAKRAGFEFDALPVAHPGIEQKAAWLQIRQQRPDYVFLWGWGVMNSTRCARRWRWATRASRCTACGGPAPSRTWPPSDKAATGYNALTLQHSAEHARVHRDLMTHVYDKGQGAGKARGRRPGALQPRHAQRDAGRRGGARCAELASASKPLTGEQVRWGVEHLDIDDARIQALGMDGMLQPLKTSCRGPRRRAQVPRPHLGRDALELQRPTGTSPTRGCCSPMMDEAAEEVRRRRSRSQPRDCSAENEGEAHHGCTTISTHAAAAPALSALP